MNSFEKNGALVMELNGRLDSIRAQEVEAEIRGELARHPGLPLCLDADSLTYISSSGLRVLLRLVRENQQLKVVNVSPEVYDIFQQTGFDTLMDIQKKKRRVSVEGCKVIGSGAYGTVYQLDGDTVVKVFQGGEELLPMIENEKERSRRAFLSGIPTAIPFDIVQTEDGRFGAVYELIDARNCNDIIRNDPTAVQWLLPQYAAFLKNLHSLQAKPGELKENRSLYLEETEVFSCLEKPVADRLRELLEGIPQEYGLIHGDIQLKNVMLSDGSMILIDMDRLSVGNPVFELADLFAAYIAFNEDDPENSMQFFGISRETSALIYEKTMKLYFQSLDEKQFQEALKKVETMGYLRFLEILIVEMKDVQSELKNLRIRHSAEHLASLVFAVDSLAV